MCPWSAFFLQIHILYSTQMNLERRVLLCISHILSGFLQFWWQDWWVKTNI